MNLVADPGPGTRRRGVAVVLRYVPVTDVLGVPTDEPAPAAHPRPPRVGLAAFAATLAVTAAAAGVAGYRWAAPDGERAGPCEAHRVDGAEAVAVSRSVQAASPQVAGIVRAAARFHDAHPDDTGPQVPAGTYVAVIVDLAARPDLATPGLLTALEEAAGSGGVAGVHGLVANPDLHLPGPDGEALDSLRSTVARQQAAPGGDSGAPCPL